MNIIMENMTKGNESFQTENDTKAFPEDIIIILVQLDGYLCLFWTTSGYLC